jgi:arylformamidase
MLDISVPLSNQLPTWPGSPGVRIQRLQSMKEGADANVSRLDIDIHSGTHIDAPLHFIKDGKTTAEIPLERLVGPCQVVHLPGIPHITADDLARAGIHKDTTRLLLKTDNSRFWENPHHTFQPDFCALKPDAAQWVVDQGIELVGIDYHSIQLYHDPIDTHVILLQAETIILEGLDLRVVTPGQYRLICLPLKIEGVEGASARAILEEL